jgi:hypothetical protein
MAGAANERTGVESMTEGVLKCSPHILKWTGGVTVSQV